MTQADEISWMYIEVSFIIFGVAIAGVVICAVALWMKYRRSRVFQFQISDNIIQGFFNGLPNSEELFDKYPYLLEDEIVKSAIQIENDILVSGHFGETKKGKLTTQDEEGHEKSLTVAVNTVSIMVCANRIVSEPERKEAEKKFNLFLKEVKILQEIKRNGGHENVIKYIGSVTKNIKHFNVNVILEYCEGGDLKTFLVNNKAQFRNTYQDSNKTESAITTGYSKLSFAGHQENIENLHKFDSDDLIHWSQEIASGMAYLDYLQVNHFDLTTRNILLAQVEEKFVAKINDFGLTNAYYQPDTDVTVNWQTSSPRVNLRMTVNTHIWSYGVILWEIFMLGDDFDENLEKESQVKRPELANCDVYKIMLKCFNKCAEQRPTFEQLKKDFQSLYLHADTQQNRTPSVLASDNEDQGDGDDNFMEHYFCGLSQPLL